MRDRVRDGVALVLRSTVPRTRYHFSKSRRVQKVISCAAVGKQFGAGSCFQGTYSTISQFGGLLGMLFAVVSKSQVQREVNGIEFGKGNTGMQG